MMLLLDNVLISDKDSDSSMDSGSLVDMAERDFDVDSEIEAQT
jgi:hypothetical protein